MNSALSENHLTALHIAAYKGNKMAIEALVETNADTNAVSSHGMNVLHYAAQGDQPWAIVYFKNKCHMSIEVEDDMGNKPLHWACYFGAAQAGTLLLKWRKSINTPNKRGDTPLHLAVVSVLADSSSRLLKLLLFLGADREAKDNKGRRPIDLVAEAEAEAEAETETEKEQTREHLAKTDVARGIRESLRSDLGIPTGCLSVMTKLPLKKIDGTRYLIWVFYIFQLCHMLIVLFCALPRLFTKGKICFNI